MAKEQKYTPRKISGFLEWLPEVRLVELNWIDKIREIFELYGFCSIETTSVEEIPVLTSKGEDTDKEIYTLKRIHDNPRDSSDSRLGMHFDLTVPLARYVALHYNDLVFPFKRYQIQKVWRGERPQDGRYREFYQADVDIICNGQVPLFYDAEVVMIAYRVLKALDVADFEIRINNRKVLTGMLEAIGVQDTANIIRTIDKLDKLSEADVVEILKEKELSDEQVQTCLQFAQIKTTDNSFMSQIKALNLKSDLLQEGIEELLFVNEALKDLPPGTIITDLAIARGLDYYTGTVYEAKFTEFPTFPTIVSGGRYDNLSTTFINKELPGVGISIGLSRIFAKMLTEGRLQTNRKSPADVLVTWVDNDKFTMAWEAANQLRQNGVNVELYHKADKLKKQIAYCSKKGIPYILFMPYEDGSPYEIKNLETREQFAVDVATWKP